MKKIILCLILIGFLGAFVEVPQGWRHRKTVCDLKAYNEGEIQSYSKGDTIAQVFIADRPPDSANPNLITKTLFFTCSYDAGFSWHLPVNVVPVHSVLWPRIVIDNSSRIYVACSYYDESGTQSVIAVYTSENMGNDWVLSYQDWSGVDSMVARPWLAQKGNTVALVYLKGKQLSPVPPYHDTFRLYFTYTQNGGQSWSQKEEIGKGPGYSPKLVIDAGGNFYALGWIFEENGDTVWKLFKRTGPNNWRDYIFPEEIPPGEWTEPNRLIRADPLYPDVIHFIYPLQNNVYYRKFQNFSFTEPIFITEGTNIDFVTEQQDKIFAVIGQLQEDPLNTYLLSYFTSFDGGNNWVHRGKLEPSYRFCYEKNKRGRGLTLIKVGFSPFQLEIGNPQFQGNDDYLVSNKEYATAYNSNKHLVRMPNTQKLYMVYEMESDTNDICFTESDDGGTTWAPYEIIAHGRAPVIHLSPNPLHPGNYDISIVFAYFFPPAWERKLMYRAKRIGPLATGWSPIIHLKMPEGYTPFKDENILYLPHLLTSCGMNVDFTAGRKFLNVILRAFKEGMLYLLHVIYEIPDDLRNITQLDPLRFYIITSAPPSFPRLCFPSFGISKHKLHVVWQDDYKIYYSETPIRRINWTPPFPISHNNVKAYNPSIEVYGDSLCVVWSEDNYGTGKHEVWMRKKKVTEPYDRWGDWDLVSKNSENYDSRYPTNSELKYTLWQEEDHNPPYDYDPWYRYDYNSQYLLGPFSNTPEHSYFPHANRYVSTAIYIFGIWTEKDHLLYRILSNRKLVAAPPFEGSAYLSYEGGEEDSTYLIQRGGIKNYGNIKVDVGQNLIYEFPLDTIYNYELEAEFYFKGNGIRKGKIITSNLDLPFEYKGNEIKKIRFQVKKENLFEDKLYLTIKNTAGPEVSLKALNIYRYEKEEEIPGGGQGIGISRMKNPILKVYPNFIKDKFILNYKINSFSFLEISIYDILGRKVYTLIKENLVAPGNYRIELKRPHNLKSGIYFLRMETQNERGIEKIILH